MAKKSPDAAALLADKLLRVLETQRRLGSPSYPLTCVRLGQLADAAAPTALVLKACNTKLFREKALLARGKALDAPVAMLDDLEILAGSPRTLEYLLVLSRTASNQAFSVADLKKKAATKLQKPFQAALNRHLAEESLPPSIGWITIKTSKRLFLLDDLRQGKGGMPRSEMVAESPALQPVDGDFDAAFTRLDQQAGRHNFVSLVDLRLALPLDSAAFNQQVLQLRRSGQYTLHAAEGRDGITADQREAGIAEEGALLLFVSRNTP